MDKSELPIVHESLKTHKINLENFLNRPLLSRAARGAWYTHPHTHTQYPYMIKV